MTCVAGVDALQRLDQPACEPVDLALSRGPVLDHLVADLPKVGDAVAPQRLGELVALLDGLVELLAVHEVDGDDEVAATEALLVLEEPLELLAGPLPEECRVVMIGMKSFTDSTESRIRACQSSPQPMSSVSRKNWMSSFTRALTSCLSSSWNHFVIRFL